jgi:hypothetical protein
VLGAPRRLTLPVVTSALRWRPSVAWAWGLGVLLAGCILSLSNLSEFLYWQF